MEPHNESINSCKLQVVSLNPKTPGFNLQPHPRCESRQEWGEAAKFFLVGMGHNSADASFEEGFQTNMDPLRTVAPPPNPCRLIQFDSVHFDLESFQSDFRLTQFVRVAVHLLGLPVQNEGILSLECAECLRCRPESEKQALVPPPKMQGVLVRGHAGRVQGYLAHKKQRPPRTLQ